MPQTLRYKKYIPFFKGTCFKSILALILISGNFCLAQDPTNILFDPSYNLKPTSNSILKIFSSEKSYQEKTSKKILLNANIQENNLNNFPFRFGLELAAVRSFKKSEGFVPGVLSYADINISKSRLYLKIEYGRFFIKNYKYNTNYASLGINYKLTDNRKSNLYLHGAILALWGKTEGGPGGGFSGLLSLRHQFILSKYVGIISSVRYPFGSFNTVMISIGMQFFTN